MKELSTETVRQNPFRSLLIIGSLCVGFVSCGQGDNLSTDIYIPPTPLYSSRINPDLPTEYPSFSLTPDCINNLEYLYDLTISDGSVFVAGNSIDKQWLVHNNGTCNWDERYRLRLISGDNLNSPIEQALYPAKAGAQVVLRIVFIAPSLPGTYRNTWQAYDPYGIPFGDTISIEIVVQP